MTDGETFERVCAFYLDHRDPERKEERLRGKDEKANGNGSQKGKAEDRGPGRSRYVPAIERREILRSAGGDKCQVDGCNNEIWLQNCHRVPFRGDGSSRAFNQYRFCRDHHVQHDSGVIRVLERHGNSIVVNRAGIVVGKLRDPP